MRFKRKNCFRRSSPFTAILTALVILSLSMCLKAAANYRDLQGLDSTNRNGQNALLAEKLVPGTVYDRNGTVLAKGKEDGSFELAKDSAPALSRLLGVPFSREGSSYTVLGAAGNLYGLGQPPFTWSRFLKGPVSGSELKGGNLELTVDAALSSFIYDLLEKSGAKEAGCLVINYRTGEVYAAVSAHGFQSLEELREAGGSAGRIPDNVPFQYTAMTGSAIKPILLAAVLELDSSLINASYDCRGSIEKNGVIVRCSHGVSHGFLENMPEALAVSCNGFMVDITFRVDQEDLYQKVQAFGFDTVLRVEGQLSYADPVFYGMPPGEADIAVMVQSRIGGANTKASLMGMARAYMALFDGGVSRAPVLIREKSVSGDASMREVPQGEDTRMCSAETADLVLSCMEAVTEKGTGRHMAAEGRRICSKTGTGEYADGTDENAVWAIAGVHPEDLAEGDQDAWLVLTCLDHYDLKEGENSGNTAGAVAGEVLRYLLREEM